MVGSVLVALGMIDGLVFARIDLSRKLLVTLAFGVRISFFIFSQTLTYLIWWSNFDFSLIHGRGISF